MKLAIDSIFRVPAIEVRAVKKSRLKKKGYRVTFVAKSQKEREGRRDPIPMRNEVREGKKKGFNFAKDFVSTAADRLIWKAREKFRKVKVHARNFIFGKRPRPRNPRPCFTTRHLNKTE